jgi:hypothetical protein
VLRHLNEIVPGTTWERKDRDEGFSYLMRQIRQCPGIAEKAAAAKLLAAFAPPDEGQTNEVRRLLSAASDEPVRQELPALLGD